MLTHGGCKGLHNITQCASDHCFDEALSQAKEHAWGSGFVWTTPGASAPNEGGAFQWLEYAKQHFGLGCSATSERRGNDKSYDIFEAQTAYDCGCIGVRPSMLVVVSGRKAQTALRVTGSDRSEGPRGYTTLHIRRGDKLGQTGCSANVRAAPEQSGPPAHGVVSSRR